MARTKSIVPLMILLSKMEISKRLGTEMLEFLAESPDGLEMQAELTKIVQESKDEQEIEQKFRQLQNHV